MHDAPPFDAERYAAEVGREGYYVRERVLGAEAVANCRAAVAAIPAGDEVRRRRSVYGVRNLLEVCPAVRALSGEETIRRFVVPLLGEAAFAVRAIFFDKVADANWSLGWHQDSVISVRQRREVDGFAAWSQKAGVWQVQPPAGVLACMLAVRVHLDDCGPENGPLRVIPGSHRDGWLDDDIDTWKERVPEVICLVGCGGIVTMRPLLLHASGPAAAVGHRRVIHIEYAAADLPSGLEWNNRVGAR